jgi:uncharacterized protein YprB with RNaseH-like and TPR domain
MIAGTMIKRELSKNWLFSFRQKQDIDPIMLQNTFMHIQSIGAITEQRIWESGLSDWDAFSDDISIPLSGKREYLLQQGIDESRQHLQQNNPVYFSNCLPANQCWRLFPEFRNSTAYLDIETTRLDRQFNKITTIALYDGQEIKTYANGQNRDDFIEDIQKYKVIVTYNGKSFDIPFIESFFNIRLNHAQIDLRYVLYSLGFRGGLKGVEHQLGTDRGNLRDVDGFFAVLLWDEYQKSGDQKALDTLLAYNVQDTVTLENLMVTAYNLKLRETPFYDNLLIEDSITPANPFTADLATIDKIKSSSQFWASGQYY